MDGGQQAEGISRMKPLVRVGEVDLEESADEADLGDPNPEFVAEYTVATELSAKRGRGAAAGFTADVWTTVQGEFLLWTWRVALSKPAAGIGRSSGEPVTQAQLQVPRP